MKLVVQRVKKASVLAGGAKVADIGRGLLVFVGVEKGDTKQDAEYLAGKVTKMRIFEDDAGKMNLDIKQTSGSVLSVSQFTLAGDVSKGNRPGFDNAEVPVEAEKLWNIFNEMIVSTGVDVQTGRFGEKMEVEIINDGPVTFVLGPNR